MKKLKQIIMALVAVLPLTFMVSCSDDDDGDGPEKGVMWDIYPVDIIIDIVDAQGNNLLDPDVPGNIVGQELTVDYEGKTYGTEWNALSLSPNQSRMILVEFYGLKHYLINRIHPYSSSRRWALFLGDLRGDCDYDTTMVLKYKDREFEIRVVNNFEWVKHLPERDTRVYLDGVIQSGQKIKIVL